MSVTTTNNSAPRKRWLLQRMLLIVFVPVLLVVDGLETPQENSVETLKQFISDTTSIERKLELADFTLADAVGVQVDTATDPNSWFIELFFGYSGPTFDHSLTILDFDSCYSEIANAPVTAYGDPPIVYNTNAFTLQLQLNVSAAAESTIWNSIGPSTSQVAFCARLDMQYEGTLVNFAKTQVTLTVGTASGDFVVFETQQSLSSSQLLSASKTLSVAYELRVYPCDNQAVELATTPIINPGAAVRFCIATASDTHAVYVSAVDSVTYVSTVGAAEEATPIQNGVPTSSLANVDCSFVAVCLVEFIPPIIYFVDGATLLIQGSAAVTFGQDSDADSGAGRRRHRNLDKKRHAARSHPSSIEVTESPSSFVFEVQLASNVDDSQEVEPKQNTVATKQAWASSAESSCNLCGAAAWTVSCLWLARWVLEV